MQHRCGTDVLILGIMKIATYNVNGVNGRLPVLLRWSECANPDIVSLQELKSPNEKFPKGALKDAGYIGIWYGQKSWNGVAILSNKFEVEVISLSLPGNIEDEQSRYLEAMGNEILVCCLYLPSENPAPGPKFDYKLEWFKRLKKHAAQFQKEKERIIGWGF